MVFRTELSSSTTRSLCTLGRPTFIRLAGGDRSIRVPVLSREHHGEAGALAGLAGHFHFSAVVLDDLLHDGEPNARARFARRLGPFGAVKLLEDLAQFLGVHADALVPHREAQIAAFLA